MLAAVECALKTKRMVIGQIMILFWLLLRRGEPRET